MQILNFSHNSFKPFDCRTGKHWQPQHRLILAKISKKFEKDIVIQNNISNVRQKGHADVIDLKKCNVPKKTYAPNINSSFLYNYK